MKTKSSIKCSETVNTSSRWRVWW